MRNRSRHNGFLLTVVRRFREEHMLQTSASLAFTTLLALVPLATLVVSLSSMLPFLEIPMQRLDTLLVESLLPPSSAKIIATHIGRFTAKARALTVPGLAMLAVTAFLLLHTVEQAFNHLWRVKPRPYLQRVGLYALVMLVLPVLMGVVATIISYAVTTSLGFFDEPTWMRRWVLKGISMLLLGMFFAFLYYAVPNARVSKRAAITGGAIATVFFSLMQQGFEWYLTAAGSFRSIYGAFATAPIFLVWLHLSWALVLVGGLITATAFAPARR